MKMGKKSILLGRDKSFEKKFFKIWFCCRFWNFHRGKFGQKRGRFGIWRTFQNVQKNLKKQLNNSKNIKNTRNWLEVRPCEMLSTQIDPEFNSALFKKNRP